MNPEAAQAWSFALAKMQAARGYMDSEQEEPAKTEIAKAVYMAAGALYYLLGQGQAEQAAHEAAQGLIQDMATGQCTAAEAYMAARKVLNFIAEQSPNEDRLPPV